MKKPLKRYLSSYLLKDLKSKILVITGARQSGKTTLSKHLGLAFDYLNYDNRKHHKILIERSWDREKKYIIFDELHKKKHWKRWLKGIYDTEGLPPGMIVTGSARLDTYKRMGDSLAGRFFHFRLHPFDVKEIVNLNLAKPEIALNQLLEFGGFPEPFLEAKTSFYGKWKKTQLDVILKQDLISLENVKSLSSIETLVQLLRDRVGSPLSYVSLAEDLNCSPKTVKNWLQILENLYVIFKINPWHKNIARSLVKAPKYYFYDTAQVRGSSLRLENLLACTLLKEIHFRADVQGQDYELFYLRNKDKKEVDFLIVKDRIPLCMLELKSSKDTLSDGLNLFLRQLKNVKAIQLVQNLEREKTFPNGAEIRKASSWLSKVSF
ncbi:MAG: ATP-binding protein [Bdellovibrionales bacterium]|nr:ATP-binding protein [Bdellovibrionales bacterium]